MCTSALVSVLSVGQVYHSFYIFFKKMLKGGGGVYYSSTKWLDWGGVTIVEV